MPQSLSNLLIHIVFSTKQRAPLIPAESAPDLYRYLAAISRAQDCPAPRIGGPEDHVHICCSLSRTRTCAKLVEEIKTGSSKWMKKHASQAEFAWQNGYGAFSIGEPQLEALKHYIDDQERHHRQVTFQQEFRELLPRHGIAYDERFVWD